MVMYMFAKYRVVLFGDWVSTLRHDLCILGPSALG